MKRTPLLFLLCLTLLSLSLFHFQTSNAKNESSGAALVHQTASQQGDAFSSKSAGANFDAFTSVGNPVQVQQWPRR
jgi:hypothetical protein